MKRFYVLVLALFGLMIGTAQADKPKAYTVTLSDAKIGSIDFDGGQYKLLIHRDEMKAQLMDLESGDVYDVSGKVETAEAKFERTEVHSSKADGVNRILEIRVGGAPFRVNFRDNSAR